MKESLERKLTLSQSRLSLQSAEQEWLHWQLQENLNGFQGESARHTILRCRQKGTNTLEGPICHNYKDEKIVKNTWTALSCRLWVSTVAQRALTLNICSPDLLCSGARETIPRISCLASKCHHRMWVLLLRTSWRWTLLEGGRVDLNN